MHSKVRAIFVHTSDHTLFFSLDHQNFCLHIAAYNIKHGIMTYPVNFNPTRTGGGKRGRPAKAVRGQALHGAGSQRKFLFGACALVWSRV